MRHMILDFNLGMRVFCGTYDVKDNIVLGKIGVKRLIRKTNIEKDMQHVLMPV